MNGLDSRAETEEEKTMRMMTRSELAGRNEGELAALFGAVSKKLVLTGRDTPERRNALATLENINRERLAKMCCV